MNIALQVELSSQLWALQPEMLTHYLGQAQGHSPARAAARHPKRANISGAIAVLPLLGPLAQRDSLLTRWFGGTALNSFSRGLRLALADDAIQQILIEIDSPGGSVYGVMELADEIYAARQQKPIVAIANSQACAAAYWIGANATEFYCTPGGQVGSIGVATAHMDRSKELEQKGIKITLIGAGKHKTEGNEFNSLGAAARAYLQSRVDDVYGAMTRSIARGRGIPADRVRKGFGQGRTLGSAAALEANMVDGVRTFDQVAARMATAAARSTVSQLTHASNQRSVVPASTWLGRHGTR